MGEFVTDLDYAYYATGDPNHVPPSPPPKSIPMPIRAMVHLPRRVATAAAAAEYTHSSTIQTPTVSSVFPTSLTVTTTNSPLTPLRRHVRGRSQDMLSTIGRKAHRRLAPGPPTEQSTSASSGLQDTTSEELRAEWSAASTSAVAASDLPRPATLSPPLPDTNSVRSESSNCVPRYECTAMIDMVHLADGILVVAEGEKNEIQEHMDADNATTSANPALRSSFTFVVPFASNN